MKITNKQQKEFQNLISKGVFGNRKDRNKGEYF